MSLEVSVPEVECPICFTKIRKYCLKMRSGKTDDFLSHHKYNGTCDRWIFMHIATALPQVDATCTLGGNTYEFEL